MKLISNFKDYYDFIIAKYGIDEKCIYIRNNKYNPHFELEPLEYKAFRIHFCNVTYFGHYYKGKFYYGKDAENYIPRILGKNDAGMKVYRGQTMDPLGRDTNDPLYKGTKYENLNEKLNCPVILNGEQGELNVRLADFGFSKVVNPENAFIKISNFLMREKEIINTQTNKEKIVSHGFDLKSSFRNPINKRK